MITAPRTKHVKVLLPAYRIFQNYRHPQFYKQDTFLPRLPTGWRPADVEEKYPVYKIEDAYNFEKYDTQATTLLHVWSWVQLSLLLSFVSYLFGNIAYIGKPNIFIYGLFLFIMVYAFTELMDGNRYALVWEIVKAATGIGLIVYLGDWFGANVFLPWVSTVLIAYFVLSVAVTAWLSFSNQSQTKESFSITDQSFSS